MSMVKCSPGELGSVISDMITEYTDEVVDALPNITKEVGKAGVKMLKSAAPAAGIGGTRYNSSFRSKVTKQTSAVTEVTLYSAAPSYRVAHLLEHGHIVRNRPGGRVLGRARAFPHWQPTEDKVNQEFENKIKLKIASTS